MLANVLIGLAVGWLLQPASGGTLFNTATITGQQLRMVAMMAVGVGNYGNLPIIVISSLCTFERAEPVAYSPVHAHARARPHGVSLTELPSHGQFSGKGSSAHGDTFRPAAEDGGSNDGFKLNPFNSPPKLHVRLPT